MKAIKTKYHGPTNFRGSRICASDGDRNRVYIGVNNELDSEDNHVNAAKALCKKMNWHGNLVRGSLPDCDVFVFVGNHKGDIGPDTFIEV